MDEIQSEKKRNEADPLEGIAGEPPGSRKGKKRRWAWVFPVVLACASAGVGVPLGMLGYDMFAAKGPAVDYGTLFPGYDYVGTKKYSDFSSILKDASLTDAKAQAVAAINASFYKLSKTPYYLSYTSQQVSAKVGVTTVQDVEAVTYASPEVTFNQNISSSAMVKTADRFYDRGQGSVDLYRTDVPSKWRDLEAKSASYDAILSERGKLFPRLYFLNVDGAKSTRTFKTYDEAQADASTYQEQGIMGYDFGIDSLLSAQVVESDQSGVKIRATMDYTTPTGFRQMAVQMKMTGGLSDNPSFSSVTIDFTLQSDLTLVKTEAEAVYTAPVGGINARCTSKDTTWYFASDTPFQDGAGEVREPAPDAEYGEAKADGEARMVKYAREKAGGIG